MKCLARLLPLLLAIAPVRADEAWPDVFDPFQVQTIYLQLDPQKWDAVRHDTDFYDTQSDLREPCQLWMSGDTPPNSFETSITVELRRKSDPALPSEANPQKVSLKIDVNEYVKGQSVRGLKKLSLENGGGGNGILKEGFAMNLHRMAAEAGYYPLNAGNASWVRLVVNGQYVGLYSFPEQRDKTFFENRGRFKEHATWLYEINGGISLDDNVNATNSPTHAELNYYPFRGPNAPPANFEQEVSEWVDMRAMLTLASVEAFVANTDGLFTKSASNQGKNSFCADFLPSLKEPRVYLPWDLDGGFNSTTWDIFADGSGQQSQRRYQTLILQHPWFGEMYRQTFSELLDGPLSEAALNAWLDQWEAAVGPALAEDPNADQGQVAGLRSYIYSRRITRPR
jgi:spore coat protein CotH